MEYKNLLSPIKIINILRTNCQRPYGFSLVADPRARELMQQDCRQSQEGGCGL